MRILLNELKKIFSPMMILITVILFLISYLMPFKSYLEGYLPNSPYKAYDYFVYEYNLNMLEKFGSTLEPEEFKNVEEDYNTLVKQADDYIVSSETFAAYNIYSYQEFCDYINISNEEYVKMSESEYEALCNKRNELCGLLNDNTEQVTEKIDFMSWIIESYKENYSPETSGIIPDLRSVLDLFEWVVVFLIISISLIIAHMPATDNLSRIPQLQYHSYTGRRILLYQLAATVIASWIVSIAFIGGIMLMYLPTGIQAFWNIPLRSFQTLEIYKNFMFDFTFGEYVMFMSGLVLLFITGMTMIVFFLSKISGNYISLIFKIIPTYIAACFLGYNTMDRAFFVNYDPETLEHLDSYDTSFVISAVILLITGTVLSAFVIVKEKKREI